MALTKLQLQRRINRWAAWFSVLAMSASLIVALCRRASLCGSAWKVCPAAGEDNTGRVLIITWIVIPPLWFFFEWIYLCPQLLHEERERIAHTHDLARNIWLALVIVLSSIFGIKGLIGD